MNFSPKRMIIGAILIIAVLALFFIVRPDDSDDDDPSEPVTPALVTGATGTDSTQPPKPEKPSPPPIPQVVVKNGEPQGGVAELEFEQGENIRFSVKSDVEEEVHVHGYDVSEPISAGGKVSFDLPADITGIFEVELENSAVPIAELQVNP